MSRLNTPQGKVLNGPATWEIGWIKKKCLNTPQGKVLNGRQGDRNLRGGIACCLNTPQGKVLNGLGGSDDLSSLIDDMS